MVRDLFETPSNPRTFLQREGERYGDAMPAASQKHRAGDLRSQLSEHLESAEALCRSRLDRKSESCSFSASALVSASLSFLAKPSFAAAAILPSASTCTFQPVCRRMRSALGPGKACLAGRCDCALSYAARLRCLGQRSASSRLHTR